MAGDRGVHYPDETGLMTSGDESDVLPRIARQAQKRYNFFYINYNPEIDPYVRVLESPCILTTYVSLELLIYFDLKFPIFSTAINIVLY